MNPVVIPQSEWLVMLTQLVGVAGAWNGALIHLFKNDFIPNDGMSLADLITADFTGYATSAAVTWGTPGFLPSGQAVVTGDAKQFETGATPTILNTIYGWYATDGAGTVLLFARRFDAPIVLNGPHQIISVLPAYVAYIGS